MLPPLEKRPPAEFPRRRCMNAQSATIKTSFDQGDAVPMLRRTQFKGERTEWLELPRASQPRFLRDRTTTLEHVQADLQGETHKLSIAIHGLRFVTPWIVVADGRGRFLSHLELRLTALGNDLSAMRILDAHYVDERPEHIAVRTVWEQANENDLASALALTFAAAALLATVLLCWTCTRHGSPAFAMLLDEKEAPRRAQLQQQQQNTRRHVSSRLGKRD